MPLLSRSSRSATAFLALALAASFAFPALRSAEAQTMTQAAPLRTITMSAEGRITAEPDLVRITVGVVSEDAVAAKALADNTQAMQASLTVLRAAGIADKDMQTSDFSVQPRYEYSQDGKPPRVTGYIVSNQLHLRVRDKSKLGAVLDELVKSGSNQISGISFEVSEPQALLDQARKTAIGNAERMARLYAEAAGAKLGRVLRIEEGRGFAEPRPVAFGRAMAADSGAVPIQAGETALEVSVTVTWELE